MSVASCCNHMSISTPIIPPSVAIAYSYAARTSSSSHRLDVPPSAPSAAVNQGCLSPVLTTLPIQSSFPVGMQQAHPLLQHIPYSPSSFLLPLQKLMSMQPGCPVVVTALLCHPLSVSCRKGNSSPALPTLPIQSSLHFLQSAAHESQCLVRSCP